MPGKPVLRISPRIFFHKLEVSGMSPDYPRPGQKRQTPYILRKEQRRCHLRVCRSKNRLTCWYVPGRRSSSGLTLAVVAGLALEGETKSRV